jgi:regulator of protease activity HflC (stomatin/prohibitin superfamily)
MEQLIQFFSNPWAIVIGIAVLFFIGWIAQGFRILQEYERGVVFFLGRAEQNVRGPGLNLLLPSIQQMRVVDIRERSLEIPRQMAISKDNAGINVDFLVYYRIVDPRQSLTAVDNAVKQATQIAATTLRSVIGDISLDDVLSKRETINEVMRVKVDETTEQWGIKVTRVEIREVEPPRDIQEAMNRQMTAERQRRATITAAEGEREAAVMVAEGQKNAAILKAEGEKTAAILKAEGEKEAQLLRAQGFASSLQAMDMEAREANPNTMALQYMETLRAVGASPSTKWVLPMEVTSMMARMSDLLVKRDGDNGNAAK